MNVLLVHNFYQQAGGEDGVFAEEAALLEDHGHAVRRFTMDNDSIEGMGKLTLAKKTIWNKQSAAALEAAAREHRAQIVHFHNTFPLVSPAGYYAAHAAGAAVVQTLHNYRLLCPVATFYRDGHVCEDCMGKSIPWPGVLHKCYRGSAAASAGVAAMLTVHRAKGTWQHQVDRYIALTEFARGKFIEGGLPADRIVIKPNFVDPDPGIGDGAGGFALFVGRLTEEKGVLPLIEAWKSVFARIGVSLRIAGDGPLRQTVEQAAADRSTGIIYEGRKPLPEIYQLMGSAAALVFPSQWYEGMPKTIVESFAKGTPVVAARLGSMNELVDDEATGIKFDPGHADSLASAAVRILSYGDSDRQKMRLAARAMFQAKYTAARNLPMLLDVYQQALTTRNPRLSIA